MRVVLVGQPNCGKSTIFNYLSGYKAIVSNFPGTTVKYTVGKLYIDGLECECVDLPGTYSLRSSDAAEREARRFLVQERVDVVVNVVDASLLSRSLELTLELLELGKPMVLVLNMVDEAERKGIKIDEGRLSELLGIPVVKTIAYTGQGLTSMVREALRVWESKVVPRPLSFSRDVEAVIAQVTEEVRQGAVDPGLPLRFLALKFLEKDPDFEAPQGPPALQRRIEEARGRLEESHGRPTDVVLSSERHALAMNLYEEVTEIIRSPRLSLRDRLDDWVMHPLWGYVILAGVFCGLFFGIFKVGSSLEEPLLGLFEGVASWIGTLVPPEGLTYSLLKGITDGVAGGVGIVLPYLVPFLLALAALEDSGYLPRVAFLVDSFMHRIGLHGKSVVPFLLGYGCSVPAVMATRILESERDRVITAVLATLIPCSARTVIILGLVSYYLGPLYAIGIYIFDLVVVGIAGMILNKVYPEVTPGLILEVPRYHLPSLRSITTKSWYRLKEFIVVAWPLLIGGSALLALLQYFGLEAAINSLLKVITSPLGLPPAVGTTLIFGVLRKELSLIMLFEALGTKEVLEVLTTAQVLTFTVFVVFYVPCLATAAALWREIGGRRTLLVLLFTFAIAFLLALGTRLTWGLMG